MIETIEAILFVRHLSSGRTRPALCICKRPNGERVEVVVKFPGACDSGPTSLAREVVAACLAGDLGLPVPEPFWVIVPPGLVPDDVATDDVVAFGSRHVGVQFSSWSPGYKPSAASYQLAAEIVAFDAITQNFDRRRENANCLVRGDEIRIIDHEATFIYGSDAGVIGWSPPWQLGGMQSSATSMNHIFADHLAPTKINFGLIEAAWMGLTDEMLNDYGQAIHPNYRAEPQIMAQVNRALDLIKGARDNIRGCMIELRRVLS